MSTWLLLTVVGMVIVNLPINAAVLWFACRMMHVKEEAVPYGRAFRLTLAIFSAGWASLCLILLLGWCTTEYSVREIAFWTMPPMSLVMPYAILKWSLASGWWRTLGVWAVWRVLTLVQLAPTFLYLRPHLYHLGG